MPRATRLSALAGSGLVAALALSACAPARPGAAAIVGSARISVAQLQSFVQRSLDDPTFASQSGADMASLQRSKLSSLVDDEVLAAAAKDKGVSVSESDVQASLSQLESQDGGADKFYADVAKNGIAKVDVHDALYYSLIEQKIEGAITVPAVHVAHILVNDEATANQILAQVEADPTQFAALAKKDSTDTASAANGGDLGTSPAALYVAPFADAVSKKPVGSYFVVHSQYGWHVVHLISRSDVSLLSLDQDAQQSQSQQEQQFVQNALGTYITGVASRVGVSVNPRYGTWDPKTAQIGATNDALSSPVSSGGAAPSSPPPSAPPASPAS